jgi:hypothetical protein
MALAATGVGEEKKEAAMGAVGSRRSTAAARGGVAAALRRGPTVPWRGGDEEEGGVED